MRSLCRLRWRAFCGLFLLWLAFAVAGVQAQSLVPIPELSKHVIDTSGTLTTEQQRALDDKLAAFEAASGSQVVVLMVPTTQPEDIASYANRVGSTWKIGRKDIGDGLLLVVAKNDRKLRIEVARALEGAVPDLAAKRIIDQTITPLFKQGDFSGGIGAGLDQIMALIRGESLPAPQAAQSSSGAGAGAGAGAGDFQWMDLAVFLFFAVAIGGTILRNMFGSKLGSVVAGGAAGVIAFVVTTSVLVAILAGVVALVFSLVSGLGRFAQSHSRGPWGGMGSGGGGWSSGSGGGFSSGGGGSFGGGGASGGW